MNLRKGMGAAVILLVFAAAGVEAQVQPSTAGGDRRSLGDIAREYRARKQAQPPPPATALPAKLNADGTVDVYAIDKYMSAVRELLEDEKFQQLDEMAAKARADKSRFPGGAWKLYNFYLAFGAPSAGEQATDADWEAHLDRLKRWSAQNEDSVTARIALAEAYLGYGWYARGGSTAENVTEKGWKLLAERAAMARAALKDASTLNDKCPHWYSAMQRLALAEGWGVERARSLFVNAITFEPTYQYYYREYADYLLPKWHGQEGDTAKFAEAVADRIGGDQGAMLYFEIAAELNCSCERDTQLEQLNWGRIRQGYEATEKLYGISMRKVNQYAYMAVHAGDITAAHQLFARIGENWDPDVWKTKAHFDETKAWAAMPSVPTTLKR